MTITSDVRLEYLEGVAAIMLKFKPDKWGKMVGVEENLALFTEFFEKPDILVLVLTLSPAGTIVPCLGFPASLKSKGVYFVKKKPENISKTNYKDSLIYGDISSTPVDQLIATVEEVGASRQAAQSGGPEPRSSAPCTYSDWHPHSKGGPWATSLSVAGEPLERQVRPRPPRGSDRLAFQQVPLEAEKLASLALSGSL